MALLLGKEGDRGAAGREQGDRRRDVDHARVPARPRSTDAFRGILGSAYRILGTAYQILGPAVFRWGHR
jgi:hypothetical protein